VVPADPEVPCLHFVRCASVEMQFAPTVAQYSCCFLASSDGQFHLEIQGGLNFQTEIQAGWSMVPATNASFRGQLI